MPHPLLTPSSHPRGTPSPWVGHTLMFLRASKPSMKRLRLPRSRSEGLPWVWEHRVRSGLGPEPSQHRDAGAKPGGGRAEPRPYRGDVEQCPELQHRLIHLCRRRQGLGAAGTQGKATVPAGRDGHFQTCHPFSTATPAQTQPSPSTCPDTMVRGTQQRAEAAQMMALPEDCAGSAQAHRQAPAPPLPHLCETPAPPRAHLCSFTHFLFLSLKKTGAGEKYPPGDVTAAPAHPATSPPAVPPYPAVPSLSPAQAGFGLQQPSLLPPRWQPVPKTCPIFPAVCPGGPQPQHSPPADDLGVGLHQVVRDVPARQVLQDVTCAPSHLGGQTDRLDGHTASFASPEHCLHLYQAALVLAPLWAGGYLGWWEPPGPLRAVGQHPVSPWSAAPAAGGRLGSCPVPAPQRFQQGWGSRGDQEAVGVGSRWAWPRPGHPAPWGRETPRYQPGVSQRRWTCPCLWLPPPPPTTWMVEGVPWHHTSWQGCSWGRCRH